MSATPPDPKSPGQLPTPIRSIARMPRGQRVAVMKGQDKGRFLDFYHDLLTASWPSFFLQLAAMFGAVNLIFA